MLSTSTQIFAGGKIENYDMMGNVPRMGVRRGDNMFLW